MYKGEPFSKRLPFWYSNFDLSVGVGRHTAAALTGVTFLTRVKKVTKKTRKGFALNPLRFAEHCKPLQMLRCRSARRGLKILFGGNLAFAA